MLSAKNCSVLAIGALPILYMFITNPIIFTTTWVWCQYQSFHAHEQFIQFIFRYHYYSDVSDFGNFYVNTNYAEILPAQNDLFVCFLYFDDNSIVLQYLPTYFFVCSTLYVFVFVLISTQACIRVAMDDKNNSLFPENNPQDRSPTNGVAENLFSGDEENSCICPNCYSSNTMFLDQEEQQEQKYAKVFCQGCGKQFVIQ